MSQQLGNARVLVIDHKDSFVFNLVEELAKRGAQTRTVRADITLDELDAHRSSLAPHLVLLSPGPGRPEDAGVTPAFLASRPEMPVLGVCLGHQAMAVACGGKVERAPRAVHGEAFEIELGDDPLFAGLPQRFPAARYHSLVVTEVPADLRVIATCHEEGTELVMALRHRTLPWLGLQFHPESFLTPGGGELVARFVHEACAHVESSRPVPSVERS